MRFIGEARARIEEDYLRILRFFRFHAAYGHGHPDAEGLHACIVARDGLSRLSRERVRMETIKLLVAARAAPTLAAMAEAGLLIPVIGGVPNLAGFENVAKAEAAAGLKADATRRLGGLAVIIAEDAERLWQRLRLTNNEHARLTAMAENWRHLSPAMGEAAARAILYGLRPEHFVDSAILAWARSPQSAHDAAWRDLVALPQRWTAPEFPLKAKDFLARGVARGPALGEALRAAEAAWIAAGFPQDAEALEKIVSRLCA